MKKILLTPVLLFVVLGFVTTSCKKKDKSTNNSTNNNTTGSTTKNMLLGTWKLYQTADDQNRNGVLDNNEKEGLDSLQSGSLVFNIDGSGKLTDIEDRDTIMYPFFWALQNSDKDIKVMIPGYDTTTSRIESLTASDLTLLNDITDSVKSWAILKK